MKRDFPLFQRILFNLCISHGISKPQLPEIITYDDILHAGKKIISESFHKIIFDLSFEQLPKLGNSYLRNSVIFSVNSILNEKDRIEAEKNDSLQTRTQLLLVVDYTLHNDKRMHFDNLRWLALYPTYIIFVNIAKRLQFGC